MILAQPFVNGPDVELVTPAAPGKTLSASTHHRRVEHAA